MQTLNTQKGMATILLVLLIGITVMLLTASMAKTLVSKKEASVSAHAQTNAKLMGWSGVSAFREFLLNNGNDGLDHIRTLHNRSVTLRHDVNQKEIIAKNIRVQGCETGNPICTVTADISSDHKTAQAATTIEATYDLTINNGTSTIAGETTSLNFSGLTSFSGTTLEAEIPNSKVTINVDGRLEIHAGFKTKNISELNINTTGSALIDCSTSKCGNTKINVNAGKHVHITHPGNFGKIYSKDWVKLQTGVKADEIYAVDNVHLALNSSATVIHSGKDVSITEGSSAGLIHAKGDVMLTTDARANQINAQGSIELYLDSEVQGDLIAGKHIILSASRAMSNAKAYHYVSLDTISNVAGSVYAKGLRGYPITGSIVRLTTSKIQGNVYLNNGRLSLLDGFLADDILGNVYFKGSSNIYLPEGIAGSVNSHVNPMPELDFIVPNVVDTQAISAHVDGEMDFETRIDVRVYKDQANYIFTKDTKVARVFLNHLRNENTQITYMYENGKQYQVLNGVKTYVNDTGFYLGKYNIGSEQYVGAICLNIDRKHSDIQSGVCTSEIIGYLPRVSVEAKISIGLLDTFGIPHDYHHTHTRLGELVGEGFHTWYVRSLSAPSSFDNATLAPGIMYFEGDLNMAGEANWNADSSSNVFTNTFLAERDINAIAISPRIYSPYNVIREANADVICNRSLRTVTNTNAPATTPTTISSVYLTPVNLCKSANAFRYDMDLNADGTQQKVMIDGVPTDKLDLGFVGLMSNRMIRIGACAQVYGDVLARSYIEKTAACGWNAQPNKIVGAISTQGKDPYIQGFSQLNAVTAGSNIVVPSPDYTNFKNQGDQVVSTGPVVESSKLKWAKYR